MKNSLKKVNVLYSLLLGLLITVSVAACVASTDRQESTGQYMDNSALTAKVKAKLLAEPTVKSLPIIVTSYKGIVQLSGFVESSGQEMIAVKSALAVPGVTKVEDHLSIRH